MNWNIFAITLQALHDAFDKENDDDDDYDEYIGKGYRKYLNAEDVGGFNENEDDEFLDDEDDGLLDEYGLDDGLLDEDEDGDDEDKYDEYAND